jgi:Carboxypeptidase regulatory-like domain/TonB dependent receptor-like, beta-barrel
VVTPGHGAKSSVYHPGKASLRLARHRPLLLGALGRRSLPIAFVLLFALAVSVRAQVSSGSIEGYVYDPSGALIRNAAIRVSDSNSVVLRRTTTGSEGGYSIAELSPGVYKVSASYTGFGEVTQEDVRVLVNTRTTADFHLPVAGQNRTITVSAPSTEVQPQTSEVGTVIEQQQIESVPLNKRDFLQLALLAPGVAPPVQGSELSSYGAFSMSAGGGREEANDFLLDGVDNNDPYVNRYGVEPPMDSIQEFKVATNSYDAEYGRSSGGQINVITREGTNDFHGSAYEYLRNRVLDARNFFDTAQTPAKLIRNQFGFSVGGPVVHDKTFFFASTDWFRDREGLSQQATIPTLAEAGGDFSALCQTGFTSGVCNLPPNPNPQNLSALQIYDPLTGQPFANDKIPPGDISSVAKSILSTMYPAPGNSSTFTSSPVQSENDSFGTYRVDQRLTASDNLTGRYNFTHFYLFEPWGGSSNGSSSNLAPGFGDYVNDDVQNVMIQYRRILSSRMVNTASLSYGRFSRDVLPENFNVNVGQLWNVSWLNVPPSGYGFPAISVAGISGAGDNTTLPDYRHTNTFQIGDQLAFDRGTHALKVGAEFRDLQLNGTLDYFNRGDLLFFGQITGQGPTSECGTPTAPTGVTCGSGLADLLLGYPSFALQSQGVVSIVMRSKTYAAYLQDDWKISHKLTLNLGMRYEYFTPPVDPSNQMYTFDQQTGTVVQVGTNGFPRAGTRSDKNDFAPRIGFAWNPGWSLAVRGGYGVYYDGGMFETNSAMFFNPPVFTLNAYAPLTGLLTLDNPFSSSCPFCVATQLSVVSPKMSTPYVQQWNLTFQRPLGSLGVLSLGYAGAKGTDLIRTYDLNQPTLASDPGYCEQNPTLGDCPISARTPYPNFGTIFYINTNANSSYNSLQATFNRRMSAHVSMWLAYTWSHSIDDQSAFINTIADPNVPQNSHNLAGERANSSFDMRHRLVLTYVIELPNGNLWTRNTEVHGITTVQSGQWFTPTVEFNNSMTNNTGQQSGSDRPNLVGDPNSGACPNGHAVRTADCWFNTSAFAIAPPYTFGDAGRNSLVGPDLATFDLSVLRRFTLTERFRLVAEAQAFNLFNRVNFKLPEAAIPQGYIATQPSTAGSLGEILSAYPARQIQVALRLTF